MSADPESEAPLAIAGGLENVRSQFPVTAAGPYFDSATLGPLPNTARVAADRALTALNSNPTDDVFAYCLAKLEDVRRLAARLLRAPEANVAILGSTTESLSLVAQGRRWTPGDEVVFYAGDFPNDRYVWEPLRAHGVTLVALPEHAGGLDPDSLISQITERTRVVCLSLVNYSTGRPVDIGAVADRCRAVGALLVVDAIQAMGVLDIDCTALGADIVAARGYKFLLSGFGAAICYVSDRAIAEIFPPRPGLMGMADLAANVHDLSVTYRAADGAKRYEASLPDPVALACLDASLRLLISVGTVAIEQHVLSLNRQIADHAIELGYAVAGRGADRSPILSLHRDHLRPDTMLAGLRAHGVRCQVRQDAVRIATHVFNNVDDVAALTSALRDLR